ncbi:MAG: VOC family protein [Acidobacteria bacterium]|nr:VOC family protein [Acidobacteriota bacterium]
MPTPSVRGRLLWFELMTTDLDAAERFYAAVVGWKPKASNASSMPMRYTEWHRSDGVPVGGAMALTPEMAGVPPHWMLYFGVDSFADGAAQATKLGAGPLSPVIDVPNVGRMQTLKDPQGAPFSIYQPNEPPPPTEGEPTVGDVSWLELYTTDSAAAFAFYRDLFGWQSTENMDMGEMGVYRMFGQSARSLGGMMTKMGDMAHMPSAWLIYFWVPEIRAAAKRVTDNGGTVINGPMQVPGGTWILQGTDPQGAFFCLNAAKE